MTSPAPLPNGLDHRTLVNQANAQLSTGPRTEETKAISAQNSFKHGLAGLAFKVLPEEDQEAFDELHAAFLTQFGPQSHIERVLIQELTQQYWLSQRAIRMQNLCFGPDGQLNDRRLSLFLRYMNTHRRLFDQLFEQLTRIQDAYAAQAGFVSQMPSEAELHAMFSMPPVPSLPAAPSQKPQPTLTRRQIRKQQRKNNR